MIHDHELINKLGEFPQTKFEGRVYRATGIGADPTAPSMSGGRWAPSSMDEVTLVRHLAVMLTALAVSLGVPFVLLRWRARK